MSPAADATFLAVSDLGWHIVFRQDTAEALSTLNLIERVAWVSGAIAILIGSAVAIIFAQAVTRPLTRLASAARVMGTGRLDVRLPKASSDELGGLTNAFRAMSDRLQAMITTLEARTDDLSQAIALEIEAGMRLALRLYSLALYLLPRDLREPFGPEMVELFEKRVGGARKRRGVFDPRKGCRQKTWCYVLPPPPECANILCEMGVHVETTVRKWRILSPLGG